MSKDTLTMPSDSFREVMKLFQIDMDRIESFEIFHVSNVVHLDVTLKRRMHHCPVCGTETAKISNYVRKKIRHSVINTNECVIDYHARRYRCPLCNKTFFEDNPFSFGTDRSSAATVYNVLQDLKNPSETFTNVAERYHLSPTTVINIFDRYVRIPRHPLPSVLSIDEVFVPTDDGNKYICVLLDFESQKVVDILPSRHKKDLIDYFSSIPREERLNVKMMSSDMWNTYHIISRTYLPEAARSVDKFHLLMEFSRQFTHIRCKAMKKYGMIKSAYAREKASRTLTMQEESTYKDACQKYYALKKFNWLFYSTSEKILDPNCRKRYNTVLGRYMNYYDIHDFMIHCDRDLDTACDLKFQLDSFFGQCTYENAREELEKLIKDFRDSGIEEMRHYSGTLSQWKNEIVNSFMEIDHSRINNGRIENINKSIKTLKRNANGYKNFERLRKRIMWSVNKTEAISIASIQKR